MGKTTSTDTNGPERKARTSMDKVRILSIVLGKAIPLTSYERTELLYAVETFAFEFNLDDRPEIFDRIAIW